MVDEDEYKNSTIPDEESASVQKEGGEGGPADDDEYQD